MLGIIGGSGLYGLEGFSFAERVQVPTPYGHPSDSVVLGTTGNEAVAFLPRHGGGHHLTPTELPYQANIYALKAVGVTHLLTVSAVGSLRGHLPPRSVVLPDQIIDRTVDRPRSFFGNGIVAHVGLAEPYCDRFSCQVASAARMIDQSVEVGGTYVCIEGPQFSTRAESHLYRSWGGAVIGMTAMPEARLAREAEMCYATLAMVTDFDVWHEVEDDVSVEVVAKVLKQNSADAQHIIEQLCKTGIESGECGCRDALAHAIITEPTHISADARARIGIIGGRYLGSEP